MDIKRCAIYARVSTDQQSDSIDNQVSQAKEFISRLGNEFTTNDELVYIDESVSGYYTSVFDRHSMKNAMSDAKKGNFQVIVFKEISRVGRDKQENPAIIGMFEQYGIRVIAINDYYDSLKKDSITFDILSVLAEQESKKISVRVSSAKRQKAKRGQWNGENPLGYKVDKLTQKLVIDEDKKEIPELIFDSYVNKGMGTFRIAQYLNNKGLFTKNNKLWSRKTVQDILVNQVYIGKIVYGVRKNELKREYDDVGKMTKKKMQSKTDKKDWVIIDGAHEPIIDKTLFYKAQKILLDRGHNRKPKRIEHPLTGLLICGKCNKGMVCQKRSNKNKDYRYYICKTYHKYGRNMCSQANINAYEIESYILQVLQDKLNNIPDDLFIIAANYKNDIDQIENNVKKMQKKKDKIQRDQRDLFSQRELFTDDGYREQMFEFKKQMEYIENELLLLQEQKISIEQKSDQSLSFKEVLDEFKNIDLSDLPRLRNMFHELIQGITVNNDHLDIKYKSDFIS